MLRGFLFDVDGTLIDNNRAHVDAWREALAAEGVRRTDAELFAQVGKGADRYVEAIAPDLAPEAADRVRKGHAERYKAVIDQQLPFCGARDLLAEVRAQGLKVALASSAVRDELEVYLEKLDARPLVDAVVTKDDVASSKPAPDVFAAALRKLGLSADEAVVVGDTPYDLQAARAAGVPAIAVLSGGIPLAALDAEDPIATFEDVADLHRHLFGVFTMLGFKGRRELRLR